MLVGSVGGGIWRTTNSGTTWARVDDFMGNLRAAMTPSAAVTTVNWTQIDNGGTPLPNRYVTDLAISGTTYYATFGGYAGLRPY